MEAEIDCPVCGEIFCLEIEIDDPEGGSVEATVQRRLTVICPTCGESVDVGPIGTSGGSRQVVCEGCTEHLDVEWGAELVPGHLWWVETLARRPRSRKGLPLSHRQRRPRSSPALW